MRQANLLSESLDQYFTPAWAAELIVARYFSDLSERDTVVEPSCGDGRFLMAIPHQIDAYGVEIDPAVAAVAARNSGREVIVADFIHANLPRRPTVVIGNPPFSIDTVNAMLARCHEDMDYGGRIGFILPVSIFQTANTVISYQRKWSIAQDLIPRNLFDRLRMPLMFARFKKEKQTTSVGLFLYAETQAIESMQKEMRRLMLGNNSTATCWRDIVALALKACGGTATLAQLYICIEGNRPTPNPWWKEKIRQVAGRHFKRIGPGEYATI